MTFVMAEGEIKMKANIHPNYVDATVTCAFVVYTFSLLV